MKLLLWMASFQALILLACPASRPLQAGTSEILFLGTVLQEGLITVFHIDEHFDGSTETTVSMVVNSDAFVLGQQFLVDAVRTGEEVMVRPCGFTGPIWQEDTGHLLGLLRGRSPEAQNSSMQLLVTSQAEPLAGVEVTLTGQTGETFKQITDESGFAQFSELRPSVYTATAALENYVLKETETLNLTAGSCWSSLLELRSKARVSGFVRNPSGAPRAALELTLLTSSEEGEPAAARVFNTTTEQDGSFLFADVLPGRYFLGTNVGFGSMSSVPTAYYPNQASPAGAIVIDVKPGEKVENLPFTLPDFGPVRNMQICVVDGQSQPVRGAAIRSYGLVLLKGLSVTGESGCVENTGLARLSYEIFASVAESETSPYQSADTVSIAPGELPVRLILTVK